MKLASFFKTLNKKIEKYERMTKNPFNISRSIFIIWVEDDKNPLEDFYPKPSDYN